MTLVGGVPLIVGMVFGISSTVIVNAGSDAATRPSLTEITTLAKVPTLLASGVPLRAPVDALKLAQTGRFAIEKVSELLSGSDAVGVNEYAWPTVALVAGVPLIVGASLPTSRTSIENCG